MSRRRRWTILGVAGAALALGTWVWGEDGPALPRRPDHAPALFSDLAKECRAEDLAGARRRADDAARAAQARWMRYPFDAQDGLDAVHSLHEAALCSRDAAQEREAAWFESQRDAARGQIQEDYQMHVLRLDHMLEAKRWRDALGETHALLALLADRDGPYADWLVRLERHLALRADSSEERTAPR